MFPETSSAPPWFYRKVYSWAYYMSRSFYFDRNWWRSCDSSLDEHNSGQKSHEQKETIGTPVSQGLAVIWNGLVTGCGLRELSHLTLMVKETLVADAACIDEKGVLYCWCFGGWEEPFPKTMQVKERLCLSRLNYIMNKEDKLILRYRDKSCQWPSKNFLSRVSQWLGHLCKYPSTCAWAQTILYSCTQGEDMLVIWINNFS